MQEESPYPIVREDTTIIRLRPAPRPPVPVKASRAVARPEHAAAAADPPRTSKRSRLSRFVIAGFCAVALALLVIFGTRLGGHAASSKPLPAAPAGEPRAAAALATVAISTDDVRELLAPQVAQGLVQIEPTPNAGVLLTLNAADLFASGQEIVNLRYVGLIRAIGIALQKTSAHFQVVGHTDDQRIHTARFPDNVALSLERAREVADLMREGTGAGGRIDFEGEGSRQPRYLPANSPLNRARNRRIEIIVQAGG